MPEISELLHLDPRIYMAVGLIGAAGVLHLSGGMAAKSNRFGDARFA